MSDSCRRSLLFLLSVAAMAMFAVTAFAECDTECNPYYSYCSQECDVCTHWGIDDCTAWRSSTCGDEMGACLQANCTSNWVEQSRVTQGTYDGRSLTNCNHHLVQWVTTTDQNHCNVNSAYQTLSYCADVIDDYIHNQCCYPSCCDASGDLGTAMFCDGHHSCTG